jgi:serine/threonine protein kinase
MKVFRGDDMIKADFESIVLQELKNGNVSNIPEVISLYSSEHIDYHALIITPVGDSVLPCSFDVTPRMLVTLLEVIEHVHTIGWIHRDIKPDNIFLNSNDKTMIILNDWSSAVRRDTAESEYVGTCLYGDGPTRLNFHSPTPQLDLKCFLKTVFCLIKQRQHMVKNQQEAIQYWENVETIYPRFKYAMELAENNQYNQLKEALLLNIC